MTVRRNTNDRSVLVLLDARPIRRKLQVVLIFRNSVHVSSSIVTWLSVCPRWHLFSPYLSERTTMYFVPADGPQIFHDEEADNFCAIKRLLLSIAICLCVCCRLVSEPDLLVKMCVHSRHTYVPMAEKQGRESRLSCEHERTR